MSKTAVITGASGGIGRAVCKTLAGMGFGVVMVGRDREKLERARREMEISEGAARIFVCDVTDRGAVKGMVEEVGQVDVLVCAAGINIAQRSLRSLDPGEWDRVIDVNLNGAFNVIHFVLPGMRARGDGIIIQIGSVSGLRANVLAGPAYSASKFAQMALGVCIGREERGRGIRSTVICPGEVNTPFLDQRAGRPGGTDGAGRRELILQPEDVAAAVKFVVELPARCMCRSW